MPPPGRGRGRGRGRGHHPGPHRPHPHPAPVRHPHPAPVRHPQPHPHPRPGVGVAVGAAIGAAVGAAAVAAAKPHPKPHPHPQPVIGGGGAAVSFSRFYHWSNGAVVVIQHALGKYLRVLDGKLDFEGGTGKLARWKVHIHEHGKVLQLQSMHNGKFLRMQPNGNNFDVEGIAKGPNTYFIIERKSTGVAFLKTQKTYHNNQHAYIAVMRGQAAYKRLVFYIEGQAREFERDYHFAKNNIVVIHHNQWKNIRAHPDKPKHVDPNGGVGKWARWEAIPDNQNHTVQFKNVATGKYLRIHGLLGNQIDADGNGGALTIFKRHQIGDEKNHIKLESLRHPGKFIAVDHKGIRVGAGGVHCALTVYRE